jgi:hypothetical protein
MVKGKNPFCCNGNAFMVLKPENLIVQRCRSKAFSPTCLFRFSELSALCPPATQSRDRKAKSEGGYILRNGEEFFKELLNFRRDLLE